MVKGDKEFSLSWKGEINKQPFEAQLHFRKGDNSDLYFFNKWEGTLKTDVGKMQQTFYVNKGSAVTLKEGYNLLEGRSVYKELQDKEGQKYGAWLQLDKNEIDGNKNYKVIQFQITMAMMYKRSLNGCRLRSFAILSKRTA